MLYPINFCLSKKNNGSNYDAINFMTETNLILFYSILFYSILFYSIQAYLMYRIQFLHSLLYSESWYIILF